ncbi:MAG: DNA gyrase C-terminal beta-propeller domain-containing protein [Rhizomicrobium sp.]
MKLEPGDGIVGVQTCTDGDDVLLTTHNGKCIRFGMSDLRVFASRASTGVRGIKLAPGDEVVSLALLRHTDITPAEAPAYLKQSRAARAPRSGDDGDTDAPIDDAEDGEETREEIALSMERYSELGAREQFVLAVSESGFGKRTSSYEYRVMGRGAQGIWAMKKNTAIVAGFPVEGKR